MQHQHDRLRVRGYVHVQEPGRGRGGHAGVTAAASAGLYLHEGYIAPGLAMPVMLGILPGALLGSRLLTRTKVAALRIVFGVVIAALAAQMIYLGLSGKA